MAVLLFGKTGPFIWSSVDPPVQWSGTIYAFLKEGIMGNIRVKLYEIRTSGSGGDVVSRRLYTDKFPSH